MSLLRRDVKVERKNSRKIELPVEEIGKQYEAGKTQAELAGQYKVSKATIKNRIDEYERVSGKKVKRIEKSKLPVEEIVEQYEAGKTVSELAVQYHVSQSTIQSRIKIYRWLKKKNEAEMLRKTTEQLYQEKLDMDKEEKMFNISMVYNYLKLGYSLEEVETYAKELGYYIEDVDKYLLQEVIEGKRKIASSNSIYKLLLKGYNYDEINKLAIKQGFLILNDRYQAALDRFRDDEERKENKKGEGRDD